MDDSAVVARFQWNRKEHARACQLLFRERRRRGVLRVVGWLFALLTVVVIGAILLAALSGDFELSLLSGASLVLIALWWALHRGLAGWIRAWQTGRMDPITRGMLEHRIDAEGLHVRGTGVSLDLAWSAMHAARETDEFFMFYYSPVVAYYTPKHGLPGPSGEERVRGMIRRFGPGATAAARRA